MTSRQILDVYVTSISGMALSEGTAEVSLPFAADGGVFATIELTLCSDGGWDFDADGGGTLDGTFGAAYCGSLNRTPEPDALTAL